MQLSKWLKVQGLERLDTHLRQAGIDLDILFDLDDADLEKIGLSFGDRKRLLKALQASPPVAGETKNAGPTALAIETSAKVAERRQLTVMFCDLVGSTGLSGQLDPEDLQQVLGCYHQSVTAAVRPYDGHIAQLLGDGVLVYFGYPKAHEDDADRAVRAGLAVIEAVGKARPTGVLQMQTRVGIATGLVVVSEVGAGTPAAEFSASGETPNLAARLQALAKPGEIVIAPDTRRLIGESFELSSLGMQSLKGIVKPIEPWRVVGVRAVSSRFEADHAQELTRFVGRDGELSTLLERWSMAREGEGQVVLLSGEAGIGKSRVVQTLRDQLMQEASLTLTWQCSPYFVNSTLYPVVQQLERSAAILAAETPEARSEKLEQALAPTELSSESLGYLLKLLGLPDGGRLLAGQTPQQVKSRTLKALVDIVIGLARRQPVLLLLEDAHWIDPTTEELLGQAIERLRDARVLILVTSRPEYSANWGNPTNLTRLALSRLGQRQCVTLIGSVAGGKSLPELVVAEIVKKTDGIPLFVEELTKTVLESGLLRQTDAGYELKGSLTALAIPSTLQDSLMARLDRLAPAKEVAQVGAAIGRVFSHRLLSAVLQMPEAQLNEAINDLVRAELLFRRDDGLDAFYTFKHALVRDTAYASMVKSQRAGRHRQIAAAIEQYQPDAVEAQPELMAHHLQEAGVNDEAIGYWVKAGDRAIAGTNGAEAAAGFDAAIRLISALDDTPDRVDLELDLRRKLGYSLHISGGPNAPSLKENASIAIDLALKFDRMEYVDGFATDFAAATFASGRVAEVVSRIGPLNQDRTVALPSWGVSALTFSWRWRIGSSASWTKHGNCLPGPRRSTMRHRRLTRTRWREQIPLCSSVSRRFALERIRAIWGNPMRYRPPCFRLLDREVMYRRS